MNKLLLKTKIDDRAMNYIPNGYRVNLMKKCPDHISPQNQIYKYIHIFYILFYFKKIELILLPFIGFFAL